MRKEGEESDRETGRSEYVPCGCGGAESDGDREGMSVCGLGVREEGDEKRGVLGNSAATACSAADFAAHEAICPAQNKLNFTKTSMESPKSIITRRSMIMTTLRLPSLSLDFGFHFHPFLLRNLSYCPSLFISTPPTAPYTARTLQMIEAKSPPPSANKKEHHGRHE